MTVTATATVCPFTEGLEDVPIAVVVSAGFTVSVTCDEFDDVKFASPEYTAWISTPEEVSDVLQPFAILGRIEESVSASTPSIASDFFDSVESMHECHLTRRQRTQPEGLAQRISAWFNRVRTNWRVGRAS